MAKHKVKGKVKQEYNPEALLDEASKTDLQLAKEYYKVEANLPVGNTSYRQNVAYRGMTFDKYGALENDFITPKMAMRLAQLVYRRFGIVRHALDTMAEFTVNGIDFLSKKETSRDAMLGWAQGVKLKPFLDQVALEYYRSGNVYIYRFETTVKDSAVRDLTKLFGIKGSVKIPTKYIVLNPTIVDFVTTSLFNNAYYQVTLPASEVAVMVQHYKDNPDALKELPDEFKQGVQDYLGKDAKRAGNLVLKLDSANMMVIHRKKQSYEPYAWPFLTGTFDDLEFRQELRNMDKALARVVAKILIHVAVGDADHIPSPAALDAFRNKLSSASTETYLVTDGLVKVNEYYPDVAQMLDPKKYEAVTSDIKAALGISPAAYGDSTGHFGNNILGIKVLIERIIDGRSKILEEFLIPETRRVSQIFNLKSPVKPKILGADLNDEKEWAKIYTRLYEDGVLSPQSVIESIGDGRFPSYDEELQRQPEAKALKDEGLFVSNVNRGGDSQQSGRPSGTENPTQSSPKKTSPKGSKVMALRLFSQEEYDDAISLASSFVKNKFNIKKLNEEQLKVIDGTCKEFLLSQEFNKNDFKKFLNKID